MRAQLTILAMLAADAPGFMRLDILRGGRCRLGVLVVDETGAATELYAAWLE